MIPPTHAFNFKILCILEITYCGKSILLLTSNKLRLNRKKNVFIWPDVDVRGSRGGTNENVLPHGKGMDGRSWQLGTQPL